MAPVKALVARALLSQALVRRQYAILIPAALAPPRALALMGLSVLVRVTLVGVRRPAPPKRVRLTQPLGQGRGWRRRKILRAALPQRELARSLLGKKQLVKRVLRKGALMLRCEVLSTVLAEGVKTRVGRVVLRAVALKLAQARDIADRGVVARLVMLKAALRGGRLLAQAKGAMLSAPLSRVALRAAPANPALVKVVRLRAAPLRLVPVKVLLHAPAPLALPGALGLVDSSKIRVNRRKAPLIAGLTRLGPSPRVRDRRQPSGVGHLSPALRSRRASQWTRHLKPP